MTVIKDRWDNPEKFNVVLFGDTGQWPKSLHPTVKGWVTKDYGKDGAVLSDVLDEYNQWKLENEGVDVVADNYVFVCVAGEEDIRGEKAVEELTTTFKSIMNAIKGRMIFFGPKLGPWLIEDEASRKKINELNSSFKSAFAEHGSSDVSYFDCLTFFCTRSTAGRCCKDPNAIPMPDLKFFEEDGVHLGYLGYLVWVQLVEEKLGYPPNPRLKPSTHWVDAQ